MDIKVPEVGESVFEAEIGKWHKKDGDRVEKDDLLCELETDKITLELNADAAGTLSIKAREGETVEIGAVIATIEEGEAKEGKEEKEEEEKKQEAEEEKSRKEEGEKKKEKEAPPEEKEKKRKAEAEEQKREKEKIETPKKEAPAKPEGEKPEAKEKKEPAPAPSEIEGVERTTRQQMTRIRKRIAERLLAARQQTAMLTTFNEADIGRVMELRHKHRESFEKKHGVSLGLMSFFVKACVEALREFPEVNARIDGDAIVYHHFYDIGIAVGSEKGLVVPVLRDADTLHFADIERHISGFVEKIRNNDITLEDLEGGTFTITNGGVYGSLLSTPILNPPQSAVLGMHAIQDRPVAIEGKVEIRPMMYLALSYDHRLIDGRQAVSFLKRIKEYVEEPEEIFLEM
jgi:2-oxoglutarate dehydrogenase E2 component (dihydrolipoamide succinyltransferase)